VQYLLALAHEEHFLLSQRMGQRKGNLLLHRSPIDNREAEPPKSAEIFIALAPGTAGLHFTQCSLAPISWLHTSMRAHPLTATLHQGVCSTGYNAGQLQAEETYASATSGFAFTSYSPI